jgi:hypothetical protein
VALFGRVCQLSALGESRLMGVSRLGFVTPVLTRMGWAAVASGAGVLAEARAGKRTDESMREAVRMRRIFSSKV